MAVDLTDASTVVAWARAHGVLRGRIKTDALELEFTLGPTPVAARAPASHNEPIDLRSDEYKRLLGRQLSVEELARLP